VVNENAFKIKKNGKPTSRCFCRKPELIEETKDKISKARRGKKHSDETKAKISSSMKTVWAKK